MSRIDARPCTSTVAIVKPQNHNAAAAERATPSSETMCSHVIGASCKHEWNYFLHSDPDIFLGFSESVVYIANATRLYTSV